MPGIAFESLGIYAASVYRVPVAVGIAALNLAILFLKFLLLFV